MSLPEVVAESLIEATRTRLLAVPDRHQGLGRPPEAPFLPRATSWPLSQETASGSRRSSFPQRPEPALTLLLLGVMDQSYPSPLFRLPTVSSLGK